jgi:hypothetical protein
VFSTDSDPVQDGIVASLSRPGGSAAVPTTLGRGIARFAEAGAPVVAVARSGPALAELATTSANIFADAGGLMSYGADGPALFRQGAKFVQRIWQGSSRRTCP